MSNLRPPLTYRGRNIGIAALVAAQLLVGSVHVFFGLWLLSAQRIEPFSGFLGSASGPNIYSIYTVVFGALTLAFAGLLWLEKLSGWIGSVTVAVFVIAADSLTLLDLPSIPGIPKFAGFGEISYSLIVLIYLLQTHVRVRYRTSLEKNKT